MMNSDPMQATVSTNAVTLQMPARFHFSGSGTGLFANLIVGYLLTIVTLGLYLPWFLCRMGDWVASNVMLRDQRGHEVQLRFHGNGAELFGIIFVGVILTSLTFGIYGFWYTTRLVRFTLENLDGETSDGTSVDLTFSGTGGDLFANMFLGCLLMILTLGIYSPWFFCRIHRWFYENTLVHVGSGEPIRLRFTGKGGDLFATVIVGWILTVLTLGIYMFWLQVQLMHFQSGNTEITTPTGRKLDTEFTGTGGEYALICIVGFILTPLTLGLYGFRLVARLIQFQVDHLVIRSA